MLNIFISYRRDDAAAEAGRLYDALKRGFGAEHVFRDIYALKPGENFAIAIERHGQLVVPVLVEGAPMPRAADLPEELAALASRNALELSDARWEYELG